MLPLSALSRRALVAAATALVAVAPHAAVAKKKKPLAFALVTPTDVQVASAAEGRFECHFDWALVYPAAPYGLGTNGDSMPLAAASGAQMRAAIVATVRSRAFQKLDFAGHPVPKDRIAVVVL